MTDKIKLKQCPVCGVMLSLVRDERGGVTGAVRESEYICKVCGR